jgi:hypothetical protein
VLVEVVVVHTVQRPKQRVGRQVVAEVQPAHEGEGPPLPLRPWHCHVVVDDDDLLVVRA